MYINASAFSVSHICYITIINHSLQLSFSLLKICVTKKTEIIVKMSFPTPPTK